MSGVIQMLVIFPLMLDRHGLRLIPLHILGSELFAGLGLDRLRNSSPLGSFPFGPLMFVGGVSWRPLPRFAPIDRAGPCTVAEFPTLSTLVWQAGVQDSLCHSVVGLCSFRHRWNSNVSGKLGNIPELDGDHGPRWPFDVRIYSFYLQNFPDFARHNSQGSRVPELLV